MPHPHMKNFTTSTPRAFTFSNATPSSTAPVVLSLAMSLLAACASTPDPMNDPMMMEPSYGMGTGESFYEPSAEEYGFPEDLFLISAELRKSTLAGNLVVAPERALLDVTVQSFVEGSRKMAHDDLIERVKAIRGAAAKGGCLGSLVDAWPVERVDEGVYRGQAHMLIDVDLKGVDGVDAKLARLEACMAALDDLVDPSSASGSKIFTTGQGATHAGWIYIVEDPRVHAAPLLDLESKRRAVLARTFPPQMRPDLYRCVPTGEVLYKTVALSGIELVLEMACDAEPFPTPPAATPDVLE